MDEVGINEQGLSLEWIWIRDQQINGLNKISASGKKFMLYQSVRWIDLKIHKDFLESFVFLLFTSFKSTGVKAEE